MKRAIHNEQIIVIVNAAPLVRYGDSAVTTHAARACLVLPPAEHQLRPGAPNSVATARAQPFDAALAHEFCSRNRRRVRRPAQTRNWNTPVVANRGVDGDAAFGVGNVLNWPAHV